MEMRNYKAEWSSLAARKSHDLEVAGSNPVSAIRQSRDFPEKWYFTSLHLLADRDKRCTITRRYDMNKEYIKTILAPYEANNDFLIKDGETIDDDVLK